MTPQAPPLHQHIVNRPKVSAVAQILQAQALLPHLRRHPNETLKVQATQALHYLLK